MGRPFLRRLIERAHSVTELNQFVRLSSLERDDISWWHKLLSSWNGRSLFLYPSWDHGPRLAVTSDAAGSVGFAAIYQRQWFAGRWPPTACNLNIADQKLIPIVLAAHIWGHTWSRKRVVFRCDNMAVVLCLRQGSCRDRHLAFLLRELAIMAVLKSFTFTSVHLPGASNSQADSLSRFAFQAFFSAAPDVDLNSQPVPPPLLQHLLSPPWMSRGKSS